MTEKRNEPVKNSQPTGMQRAVPIILFAVAVFTLFCFITQDIGALGHAISALLLGLFACGAYVIPLLLAVHAVFYHADVRNNRVAARIIFSVVAVTLVSAMLHAFANWNDAFAFNVLDFFKDGQAKTGGGFIGGTVSYCLIKVFGQVGLVIIAIAVLTIYVSYFFAKTKRGIPKNLASVLMVILRFLNGVEGSVKAAFGRVKDAKTEKAKRNADQKNMELTDDEFFAVDNGMQKLSVSELGIKEVRQDADSEGKTTLHDKVFHKSAVSAEEAEAMRMREEAEEAEDLYYANLATEQADEPVAPPRRRLVNVTYDDPDSNIGRAQPGAQEEPMAEEHVPMPEFGSEPVRKDDNADAVFTHSFDPFGMMMSEALASKPSSRSLLDENPAKRVIKEDISELTKDELEREKRILEFERRKAAILEAHRPIPVDNDGEFTGTPKTVDFRERTDESLQNKPSETASSSFVFSKAERVYEAPKAEPANYTAIGFGYENGSFGTVDETASFTTPKTVYSYTPTQKINEEPVVNISISKPESYEVASENTANYTTEASTQNYTNYSAQPTEVSAPGYTNFDAQPTEVSAPGYTNFDAQPTEVSAPGYTGFGATPANESAPTYTAYTEEQKQDPTPASVPYVEEPAATILEKKMPESSYSFYSAAEDKTPTVQISVNDVDTDSYSMERTPDSSEFTYTATKGYTAPDEVAAEDEAEHEEYVPEFKSYQNTAEAAFAESSVNVINIETQPEPTVNTLKVERAYVGDDESTEDEMTATDAYAYTDTAEDDEPEEGEEYAVLTELTPEEDDSPFETEEIPPEEQNPVVQGYKDMFSALRETEPEEEPEKEEKTGELVSPDEVEDTYSEPETDYPDEGISENEDDDEPPFEHTYVKPEPKAPAPKKEEKKPEKKKPDFSNYKMPPIDLLGHDPIVDDDTSEIKENTKILIDTLASFNVTASIKGVDRGPRITRYEVVPARGVKVNSITNLFNDIKLNLAKEGIRMEAPIPGKSAIGFEIPNAKPKNVRLRELIECEEFTAATSNTFVAIGKDVAGNPVFGDISKYPHALICGATGMGKSVCINSILVSMLYKSRPDEVRLIMIDPKKVEFKMYSGIPHLLIPVITEAKQAAGALMWAVEEMERRYDLIEAHNVRNLEAYNEKVAFDPAIGEPLPKIVIVIDELADLMMQVRDPAEDLIMRIAQKARAAGIHLLIGTQRPSVQIITGAIKANIPSRISCKVTSQVDSRTIFDMKGAEDLLNRGDMLYWPVDRSAALRVQGAFVSDREVEQIMAFLKSQVSEGAYDDEVFEEINKAAQKCGNKKSGGASADDVEDDGEECGYYNDQQFLDAVELAIRAGKVSTSLLQRKLSIGYGKAAKYIDAMEEIGIVSEPRGQKPRDVLLSMDEWREKLSRVDF